MTRAQQHGAEDEVTQTPGTLLCGTTNDEFDSFDDFYLLIKCMSAPDGAPSWHYMCSSGLSPVPVMEWVLYYRLNKGLLEIVRHE